jgi:hypothetical protein
MRSDKQNVIAYRRVHCPFFCLFLCKYALQICLQVQFCENCTNSTYSTVLTVRKQQQKVVRQGFCWSAKHSLGCCSNRGTTDCCWLSCGLNLSHCKGPVSTDHMVVGQTCLRNVWTPPMAWHSDDHELCGSHVIYHCQAAGCVRQWVYCKRRVFDNLELFHLRLYSYS